MPQMFFPVYGVVHGDNAFLAVVESGDVFCEIEANPAGFRVNYFWVSTRFIYHELYWQPTGGGAGFVAPTPVRNRVNARIDYHFLYGDEANHSGMANTYRQILADRGWLTRQSPTEGDIPIKLDVIMAEQQQALIGSGTLAMTQFSDVAGWIGRLREGGLNNITIALLGAERGGISGRTTGSFNIEGSVGGQQGLTELYAAASAAGVRLVLQTDFVTGFEHQIPTRRAIYTIGGPFLTVEEPRPLYSTRRFMNMESINAVIDQADAIGNLSLGLDAIGNTLTSDFNSRDTIRRGEAKLQIQEALARLRQIPGDLLLEAPNAYAVGLADAIYNTPVTSSRQIFLQDTVPFYQMVLSGYVDLFSPMLNYRAFSPADMLILIDFNMFPAYVLTEASSNLFARSNTTNIFSSRFDDWEPMILEQYAKVNNVLRNVRGQYITAREEAAPGVFITAYSGGGIIAVNYTRQAFVYNGITIEAESALYIGG
jgi:hypothetical protein